jgi:hypothetical protein
VLPEGQNSPQKCQYGLYNEQVSVALVVEMFADDLMRELDDGVFVRYSSCGTVAYVGFE